MNPTAVLENNSLSWILIILTKTLRNLSFQIDYTLKHRAAVALMYITKYKSKTFCKFKTHSKANMYFLIRGMTIIVKPKVYYGSKFSSLHLYTAN